MCSDCAQIGEERRDEMRVQRGEETKIKKKTDQVGPSTVQKS